MRCGGGGSSEVVIQVRCPKWGGYETAICPHPVSPRTTRQIPHTHLPPEGGVWVRKADVGKDPGNILG